MQITFQSIDVEIIIESEVVIESPSGKQLTLMTLFHIDQDENLKGWICSPLKMGGCFSVLVGVDPAIVTHIDPSIDTDCQGNPRTVLQHYHNKGILEVSEDNPQNSHHRQWDIADYYNHQFPVDPNVVFNKEELASTLLEFTRDILGEKFLEV